MNNTSLIIILWLSLLNFNATLAQNSKTTKKQTLDTIYWNNADFMRAEQLRKKGEITAARKWYAKAIPVFEKEKKWEAFIEGSARLTFTYMGHQDYQEGINLSKSCLSTLERQAPLHLNNCYMVYCAMSYVYQWAFQDQLALPLLHRQLALLKNDPQPEANEKLIRCYNHLGIAYRNIGELDTALNYFLMAEEQLIASNHAVAYPATAAHTYENLGHFYSMKNNFDQAIQQTEKGLDFAIQAFGKQDLELIPYYGNLGYFYSLLDEHEQSIHYYKKVMYIINISGTTEEKYLYDWVPSTYSSVAEAYSALNNFEQALFYFNKSLDLLQNNSIRLDLKLKNLAGIGRIHLKKKEFNQALHYFERCDSISLHPPIELSNNTIFENAQVFAKIDKGSALKEMGHLEEAKIYYQKAKKLLSQIDDKNLLGQGIFIYSELADLYTQEQQLDSAFFYNQKAIIAASHNFNSNNLNQLPKAEEFKYVTAVYKVLSQKVDLIKKTALAKLRVSDKIKLLAQAINIIDLADQIHIINLKKINVLRGGQSKALIKKSIQVYRKGLSLVFDYHQLKPEPLILEKGLYYAQKMKAQQLWLTTLKSDAANFGKLPKELLEQERDVLADIHYYENLIFEAKEAGNISMAELYENDYLFEKRKTYTELLQKMEATYPRYFASKYTFVAETSHTLQDVLKEGELLLEYVLCDSHVFVLTIGKHQALEINRISLNTATTQRITAYHDMLQNSAMRRETSRMKFIQLSHQLYQQFIEPMEQQISTAQRLIIIGDGVTNYIPFETLVTSNTLKFFKNLPYLIHEYEISYHYSTTLLVKAKRSPSHQNSNMYAFAPVYDPNDYEKNPENQFRDLPLIADLNLMTFEASFAPLPESEQEIKAIVGLFHKKDKDAHYHLRQAADETTLKNNLEQSYQFIHIAGHSFADLDEPRFSGITCFQSQQKGVEDGTLYMGEIYNLHTQADLVTLSSCESGFGKLEQTEGLLGLNRAFTYAGTPNVVFSLWKVYDKVSADLMVDFYQYILEGQTYSASLRAAKLNLLKKGETAAPHFWSPYLLIGR